MEFKKIHAFVFSPCGGTLNAAKSLVRDFAHRVSMHNLTLPQNRKEDMELLLEELAIFAFPVYGGHMPPNIGDILAKVHGKNTPCILVAAYGNREYEGAFLDLAAQAEKNGFAPVAAVAAIAEHSMNPAWAAARPDEADKSLLAEYGLKCLEQAEKNRKLDKIPGAYPDKKPSPQLDIFPVTDEKKCVKCGVCADVCPTSAIPRDKPDTIIKSLCILCAACVKFCPENARSMGSPESMELLKSHLQTIMSRRCEAQLFI